MKLLSTEYALSVVLWSAVILKRQWMPGLNFFTNPTFKHFQDSLDAEMKWLTRMGLDSVVKGAQLFSEDEENKLRDLGILGYHSPKVLLDTMFI